jgi:hypothetical protein
MKRLLLVFVILILLAGCVGPADLATTTVPSDCLVHLTMVSDRGLVGIQNTDGLEILAVITPGDGWGQVVVFYRKTGCGEMPEWLSKAERCE